MKRPRHSRLIVFTLGTFLPATAAFGQLSEGLLNYWDFEGNYNDTAGAFPSSASTVADNGTPNANVSLGTGGVLGGYGLFNQGSVAVTNSDDILAAGESLTISAWFHVIAFGPDWQCLIAHGEGSDYRVARHSNTTVMSYAGGVADIPGAGVGPAVNDDNWHHVVAITEAGVSTRIWIDGTLIGTGGVPTLTNNGAAQLLIGGNPNAGGREWNGSIDDVAMWNRPLTDEEIGIIYNAGIGNTPLSALMTGSDTDGDGMPDAWENQYGLNENSDQGDDGKDGDFDKDGLTNFEEYDVYLTKPNNVDSDGDGLNDGPEVKTHLTSPTKTDTDGDTLPDGQEVNTLHSNPLSVDTDNDGLTDGSEVAAGGAGLLVAETGFGFGLHAYWPMDTNFNSVIHDITASPNGSNLIPLVPGKFGNCVQLDGIDQFLQADGDENLFDFTGAQNMTVSAWFTADVIDREWQCLIAKGDAPGHWRLHRRGLDDPPELSYCGGSADVPRHFTPLSVGTGQMHHVAAVSEHGVSARLYIDGVLVATAPAPFFTDSANPMRIGANPDTNPSRYWTGKIDDVAFWNRRLSEAEILQIWSGGQGKTINDLIFPVADVPMEFTQIQHNRATNQWTLSWLSAADQSYTLSYSTDLVDFSTFINNSIASGGATTTFGPFAVPAPAGPRVFFKVNRNDK